MYRNIFEYHVYTHDDPYLLELMDVYHEKVWEDNPAYQCRPLEEFKEMYHSILEHELKSTQEFALVAYCNNHPVAILIASEMCKVFHLRGQGCIVKHIYSFMPGAGGFLYKQLISICKDAGADWLCTHHPNAQGMQLKYKYI